MSWEEQKEGGVANDLAMNMRVMTGMSAFKFNYLFILSRSCNRLPIFGCIIITPQCIILLLRLPIWLALYHPSSISVFSSPAPKCSRRATCLENTLQQILQTVESILADSVNG